MSTMRNKNCSLSIANVLIGLYFNILANRYRSTYECTSNSMREYCQRDVNTVIIVLEIANFWDPLFVGFRLEITVL